MILSGAGCSTAASTLDAARAAVGEAMKQAEIDRADLVFLFATAHHGADVGPMLRVAVDMAGTEAVVGCSGMRVLTGQGEIGRGDFLVRNLIGMDPNTGALGITEQVEVGQTIQFNLRTAAAAREDIEQVVGRLASMTREAPPQFGLYFNCLGRGFGLYGQPDHDVSVIRKHFGELPLVGFFGNAEFAPVGGRNFVHNYTGALVLFTEQG